MAAETRSGAPDRRWLILSVIGLAQLMVILDLTVMNTGPLYPRAAPGQPGGGQGVSAASRVGGS